MDTVQSYIAKAEAQGRVPVSMVDARIATLIASQKTRKGAPADPHAPIRVIRAELSEGLRKAKSHLAKGTAYASMLRQLADAIARGDPTPPGTPAKLAEHAHNVLTGDKAELVDRNTIAAAMRTSATDAQIRLAAAEKLFRRFESAAAVGAARGTANYFRHLGSEYQGAADHWDAKADRLSHLHRVRFGSIKKLSKTARGSRP